MLRTGDQLKAARALARLGQAEVAKRAGVHANTISAMEKRGPNLLVSGFDVVARVAKVLEDAGVIFIDENGHGPGVVLKKPTAEPTSASKTSDRSRTAPPGKTRPRRSQERVGIVEATARV
jgi:transcriptional regulator with XRE-family HTH domain